MAEVEMNGMMGCDSVKPIKFGELAHGDGFFKIGCRIKFKIPEICVYQAYDPVDQVFQMFHTFSPVKIIRVKDGVELFWERSTTKGVLIGTYVLQFI
jgi:hypothetical protein